MDISVVIPVYNSIKTLPAVIEEIEGFFLESKWSYELILVDDGSTDLSWSYIEKQMLENKNIVGVKLPMNIGQQKALLQGLLKCRGEYALTMDDDGQHDIRAVLEMKKMAKEGCDLVYGIYGNVTEKGIRHMGSKIVGRFFKRRFRTLRGLRVSSFRLIHKSVYEALSDRPTDFVYLSAELLPHVKCVGNVSVMRRERYAGKSGYTVKKLVSLCFKLHWHYGMRHQLESFFKRHLTRREQRVVSPESKGTE